jgi:hypothetical protein
VTGFLATVATWKLLPAKLDASVGASGPHGFAVRIGALVTRTAASTASHPAFMTIAKRPSHRDGMARAGSADLPDGESGIFFWIGLDRILVICPSGKTGVHG